VSEKVREGYSVAAWVLGRNSVYSPIASPRAEPMIVPIVRSWMDSRMKGCRVVVLNSARGIVSGWVVVVVVVEGPAIMGLLCWVEVAVDGGLVVNGLLLGFKYGFSLVSPS